MLAASKEGYPETICCIQVHTWQRFSTVSIAGVVASEPSFAYCLAEVIVRSFFVRWVRSEPEHPYRMDGSLAQE